MKFALLIAVPIILLPAMFVWFLNIGGLVECWRKRHAVSKMQDTFKGAVEKY